MSVGTRVDSMVGRTAGSKVDLKVEKMVDLTVVPTAVWTVDRKAA